MHKFIEQLASFGTQTALVEQHKSYSYKELTDQIHAYKTQLDAQIPDQQLVVILSDYNFDAIALFFALYLKKSIIIPIVSTNQQEIDKRLAVIQPNFILHLKPNLEIQKLSKQLEHPMLTSLISTQQPGLVLFSSGSTGEPKAMIHNLANLINSYLGKKPKNLNLLVFLMFDHIGGLNTLLNCLAMGAKIILPANRNPEEVAQLIEREQVQVLPASPTFLNLMLMAKVQEKHDLSSLRMITYGTEPMPASLLQQIKEAFPKTRLLQTFGTSETGITQTSSRNSASLEIKIDDSNTEYKIVAGELWLKSQTQVLGYLNASMDSFTPDGWFKTGDLVEETADGYLKIQGRVKEVINVGGEKVLPAEVESCVLELDFIADCTAYAANNAITGQMVALDAVLNNDYDSKEARKQIRLHCQKHLANYKVPAKINIVNQTNYSERFKKKRI